MASISFHPCSTILPYSLDSATEDRLSSLRQFESSSSSTSSSSICHNLVDIKDLYDLINDIIVLPLYQQVLSHNEVHHYSIKDVLEGSFVLLDVYGATIDLVSPTKESVQELESSLRRRSGDVEVLSVYKASRRKIIKAVSKCLVQLKKIDMPHLDKDEQRVVFIVRILREAQVICLLTLKSLLAFLSGSKAGRRRSIIGKLSLHSKHSSGSQVEANQVERIDQDVFALDAKNLSTCAKTVQCLQRQLREMEMSINEIEDGLVLVSRCLVKTKETLLNVLNH